MTLDDLYGLDPIESYSDSAAEAPKGIIVKTQLVTNAIHIITLTICRFFNNSEYEANCIKSIV